MGLGAEPDCRLQGPLTVQQAIRMVRWIVADLTLLVFVQRSPPTPRFGRGEVPDVPADEPARRFCTNRSTSREKCSASRAART